jgi:2-oxoglutarate dehydrogenase E1 component
MSDKAIASALYSGNADYLESVYETYLKDPASVGDAWRQYFDRLQTEIRPGTVDVDHTAIQSALVQRSARTPAAGGAEVPATDDRFRKQASVLQLINAHRFRGHRQADLDPLNQFERPEVGELDPAHYGFTEADMDAVFNTGSLFGPPQASLREILATVRATYCGSIGAEYMHINETGEKRWIQERLESCHGAPTFCVEEQHRILDRLTAAQALEEYLHTRYVGQKRFSLEGGETVVPVLDQLIETAGIMDMQEVVIGMAHRGRLNVLVNILGKLPSELFQEFEGKKLVSEGSGDVKYHLGYSSDIETQGGPVHLTLAFNPSHLEIIDPVVEGSVRARQDRRGDAVRAQVLPILLHGDAAFAGQGVVMETFNLSQTRGYSTGGTIHIIVNNQIGFTTSDPLDSRSTLYCTDVAKIVQAPIFHVNASDPEAATFVARLAMEYRMAFGKDVVIDLICFRKHGHNESDEPLATQPLMYQRVHEHPGLRSLYADRLRRAGRISAEEADAMMPNYVAALERGEGVSQPLVCNVDKRFQIDYSPYKAANWRSVAETRLSPERAQALGEKITSHPSHFKLHRSVSKIVESRKAMTAGEHPMDWGYAENLAYASLVDEGYAVRLSGQDSGRGTFFHRHAVLHNQEDGSMYLPLQHIREGQAKFLVINSTLSEEAVLAFEYGYSSSEPHSLVIWEAQFGDFANGAQVVIDQFIASCEAKWGRLCGLVMFLPHGYDGQGPEHSSARLERYLQLCAEENMQVCIPSTPAQMFHLLRRQMLRPYRRPLVVMTPKSLLRHKLSVSPLSDVTERGYQLVIDEVDAIEPEAVERVLVCSGKVYFDLLEARRSHDVDDIAILRIEQLYPFPREELRQILARYPNAVEVVWVQEEPRNQGACAYLLESLNLFGCLHEPQQLVIVARPYSASPAVGSYTKHVEQQQVLVADALRLAQRQARAEQKKTA